MTFKNLLRAQVNEWIEELEEFMKEDSEKFTNHHWNEVLKNMYQQRIDLFSNPTKLPAEVQLTKKELKFKHEWIERCIQEVEFLLSRSNELNKEQLDRTCNLKIFYETLDNTELDQFIMFHGLIEYNEHQKVFGGSEEDAGSYYLESVYKNSVMNSIEASLVLMTMNFI